jgi:uncharacterized protein (UPF0371 family)
MQKLETEKVESLPTKPKRTNLILNLPLHIYDRVMMVSNNRNMTLEQLIIKTLEEMVGENLYLESKDIGVGIVQMPMQLVIIHKEE